MCSFPPKLTCFRVCRRPSVKSFHMCGICRHRPSAKLLGAVMLLACSDLYLLKWEGTQGINRRLQSRGCRGAGGGRCMAGPSFCLCYPASTFLSKFVASLCFTYPCCLGSVKINNSPTSTTLGVWDQHTSVRWYDIIILSCMYTSSVFASKYKATDAYGWGSEGVYRELKNKSP